MPRMVNSRSFMLPECIANSSLIQKPVKLRISLEAETKKKNWKKRRFFPYKLELLFENYKNKLDTETSWLFEMSTPNIKSFVLCGRYCFINILLSLIAKSFYEFGETFSDYLLFEKKF